MTEREKMIAELTGLLPSRRARAVYLRRDDAGLAAAIERLRKDHDEVRSKGHMATAGADLRVVERAS